MRASPAFLSSPRGTVTAAREDVPRAFSPPITAPALFHPAREEVGRSQAGDPADDDPAQIASFEDLIQKEKFHEVEPLLHTYLAAHPRSWKAYTFVGYVQLRERRIGDSIKAVAKSLELNVNNVEAHKLLGRDLSIIGRYDLAEREFEEALRLAPNSPDIHYNFGRVYAAQDDFPQAKKELEKATQLDPNYMEAYNALGFAMEALREDQAALEDYETAIRLNEGRHGKFDSPYVNLSGFYNNHSKSDLAMEYANKALELNPKSDLAYFQLAKAYRAKQDWKEEAAALEKAIVLRPWSSQYYYVLGIVDRKLGKIKESEQALETFRELDKKTAALEDRRREARRAERGLESRPE